MLWLGGSAVAAAMIGAVGLRLTGATRYGTRLGEVRVVTLKDGSVITLNTSSSIRVDMGSARRLVALEAGEALFDVASDPARPFIVEAGDAAVRAVGTSFAVRRFGSAPVEVVVREGLVEVTAPSNARPIRMGANSRLVAAGTGPMGVPARLQPDAISRELAWKDGRLAFEGEALGRAAQSFARYSDIRIVIDDPAVAREEITGLFAANDPVSFARAAALSLDLSVTVNSGEVRLQRRPIS
jgi:transmembrane sensor